METTIIAINREKFAATKNELKNLASEIRANKSSFKNEQRTNKSHSWGSEGWQKENDLRISIDSSRLQYRHKHIAYCLTKGRKYEQIEPHIREGNEPDWKFIGELQNELSN